MTVLAAQEIENAYASLNHAQNEYYAATRDELDSRRLLERAKASALTSGKIDGKNAEMRDAQLREVTEGQQQALDEAQAEVRRAEHLLKLAQLGVERCKTLLKFMEVAK